MKKLYKDLLPALDAKVVSLHNEGYCYINTKDVFNYLECKWDKFTQLSDMVDDIMCVDGHRISKSLGNELYRRELK